MDEAGELPLVVGGKVRLADKTSDHLWMVLSIKDRWGTYLIGDLEEASQIMRAARERLTLVEMAS